MRMKIKRKKEEKNRKEMVGHHWEWCMSYKAVVGVCVWDVGECD